TEGLTESLERVRLLRGPRGCAALQEGLGGPAAVLATVVEAEAVSTFGRGQRALVLLGAVPARHGADRRRCREGQDGTTCGAKCQQSTVMFTRHNAPHL